MRGDAPRKELGKAQEEKQQLVGGCRALEVVGRGNNRRDKLIAINLLLPLHKSPIWGTFSLTTP